MHEDSAPYAAPPRCDWVQCEREATHEWDRENGKGPMPLCEAHATMARGFHFGRLLRVGEEDHTPVRVTVHADIGAHAAADAAASAGLKGEALRAFSWLREVELIFEVDRQTGDAMLIEVDGYTVGGKV